MSIPYEKGGRSNQKARTRQTLVDAARRLVAEGTTPSVEDAAAAAAISRTTAYRYFPNQHALLAAAYPLIDMSSLMSPAEATDAPEARLESTVDALTRLVAEHEPELRTMFRLSLDPDFAQRGELLLRQGRRITWIEGALAPLRDQLSAADFKQLVRAIGATVGIEAYAWLTDIAQLSPEDAIRTMRWSASALLRSGIAESKEARP
jgi:AcrR family transcriptional regulator